MNKFLILFVVLCLLGAHFIVSQEEDEFLGIDANFEVLTYVIEDLESNDPSKREAGLKKVSDDPETMEIAGIRDAFAKATGLKSVDPNVDISYAHETRTVTQKTSVGEIEYKPEDHASGTITEKGLLLPEGMELTPGSSGPTKVDKKGSQVRLTANDKSIAFDPINHVGAKATGTRIRNADGIEFSPAAGDAVIRVVAFKFEQSDKSSIAVLGFQTENVDVLIPKNYQRNQNQFRDVHTIQDEEGKNTVASNYDHQETVVTVKGTGAIFLPDDQQVLLQGESAGVRLSERSVKTFGSGTIESFQEGSIHPTRTIQFTGVITDPTQEGMTIGEGTKYNVEYPGEEGNDGIDGKANGNDINFVDGAAATTPIGPGTIARLEGGAFVAHLWDGQEIEPVGNARVRVKSANGAAAIDLTRSTLGAIEFDTSGSGSFVVSYKNQKGETTITSISGSNFARVKELPRGFTYSFVQNVDGKQILTTFKSQERGLALFVTAVKNGVPVTNEVGKALWNNDEEISKLLDERVTSAVKSAAKANKLELSFASITPTEYPAEYNFQVLSELDLYKKQIAFMPSSELMTSLQRARTLCISSKCSQDETAVAALREKFNLDPNGGFDKELDAAIKKWQSESKLKPDGVIGPRTRGMLLQDETNEIRAYVRARFDELSIVNGERRKEGKAYYETDVIQFSEEELQLVALTLKTAPEKKFGVKREMIGEQGFPEQRRLKPEFEAFLHGFYRSPEFKQVSDRFYGGKVFASIPIGTNYGSGILRKFPEDSVARYRPTLDGLPVGAIKDTYRHAYFSNPGRGTNSDHAYGQAADFHIPDRTQRVEWAKALHAYSKRYEVRHRFGIYTGGTSLHFAVYNDFQSGRNNYQQNLGSQITSAEREALKKLIGLKFN